MVNVNNINSVAIKVNYNVMYQILLNNHLKYKIYTDPNYIQLLSPKAKLTNK